VFVIGEEAIEGEIDVVIVVCNIIVTAGFVLVLAAQISQQRGRCCTKDRSPWRRCGEHRVVVVVVNLADRNRIELLDRTCDRSWTRCRLVHAAANAQAVAAAAAITTSTSGRIVLDQRRPGLLRILLPVRGKDTSSSRGQQQRCACCCRCLCCNSIAVGRRRRCHGKDRALRADRRQDDVAEILLLDSVRCFFLLLVLLDLLVVDPRIVRFRSHGVSGVVGVVVGVAYNHFVGVLDL